MFIGHSSPGGDLSDEDFCSNNGTHGFESLCISNNHMEFTQANQQQQYARNRSGSWTFRRYAFYSHFKFKIDSSFFFIEFVLNYLLSAKWSHFIWATFVMMIISIYLSSNYNFVSLYFIEYDLLVSTGALVFLFTLFTNVHVLRNVSYKYMILSLFKSDDLFTKLWFVLLSFIMFY